MLTGGCPGPRVPRDPCGRLLPGGRQTVAPCPGGAGERLTAQAQTRTAGPRPWSAVRVRDFPQQVRWSRACCADF